MFSDGAGQLGRGGEEIIEDCGVDEKSLEFGACALASLIIRGRLRMRCSLFSIDLS